MEGTLSRRFCFICLSGVRHLGAWDHTDISETKQFIAYLYLHRVTFAM